MHVVEVYTKLDLDPTIHLPTQLDFIRGKFAHGRAVARVTQGAHITGIYSELEG